MDNSEANKDHSSFFEHIGYAKHKSEQGDVVIGLNMNENLLVGDGTIPSGVFASMIDIVIGSTIASIGIPTTTVNLNFTYFDLTNKGPYTAFASITYRDGKMFTGEGYVIDKSKNTVAKGIGTFKAISTSRPNF
ncbi:PaaI family thioesterase [Virgibacillus necropolis]|uniref:Thioesterase n=1 Tax=Virgibacillus necropolis TaxID=163877 RepID=A0A221MEQ4_9BACI|nr:hypothetical protein [Virgibacillus necropolis]ASN06114.1 hypothetical protein CFK40_14340 [Virgibacillus necropolis]